MRLKDNLHRFIFFLAFMTNERKYGLILKGYQYNFIFHVAALFFCNRILKLVKI